MRRGRTLWIGLAAFVLALGVATAAFAVTGQAGRSAGNCARLGAASTAQARGVVPGACRTLTNDPAARPEMQALRTEHRQEMQAWWERYGSDPTSAAAQAALAVLRAEHRDDMRALLQKYNVDAAQTACGGVTGGGCGGMMGSGYGLNGGCASGSGSGPGGGMMGGF